MSKAKIAKAVAILKFTESQLSHVKAADILQSNSTGNGKEIYLIVDDGEAEIFELHPGENIPQSNFTLLSRQNHEELVYEIAVASGLNENELEEFYKSSTVTIDSIDDFYKNLNNEVRGYSAADEAVNEIESSETYEEASKIADSLNADGCISRFTHYDRVDEVMRSKFGKKWTPGETEKPAPAMAPQVSKFDFSRSGSDVDVRRAILSERLPEEFWDNLSKRYNGPWFTKEFVNANALTEGRIANLQKTLDRIMEPNDSDYAMSENEQAEYDIAESLLKEASRELSNKKAPKGKFTALFNAPIPQSNNKGRQSDCCKPYCSEGVRTCANHK
ncbi:MAG: hypothetical protein H7318_14270 [Oligoflexus sp.]|nr:hypothetical protein [Oligoflexus sp.]